MLANAVGRGHAHDKTPMSVARKVKSEVVDLSSVILGICGDKPARLSCRIEESSARIGGFEYPPHHLSPRKGPHRHDCEINLLAALAIKQRTERCIS